MSFKASRLASALLHGRKFILGGAVAAWLGCFGEGTGSPALDLMARINLSATGIYFVERYVRGLRLP